MKTTNAVQAAAEVEITDDMYDMTIDEKSSVFLMDALGKLYSQPARAALREYLANAVDAHIEAGGNRPAIQVRLPHQRNDRILSIRDFGKGMNEEGFKTILSRYGASTKRDSNKLTGGFGLGAKSGFAVSNEFFMTSYQNGLALKVRIFKNANGKGFVEVVSRSKTTEPDGMLVEVEVPSSNLGEVSYAELLSDNFFCAYHDSEVEVIGYEDSRNAWGGHNGNWVKKTLPLASTSLHNPENYEPLEYGGALVGWMSKKASSGKNQPVRAVIGRVSYVIKHDQSAGGYSYSYAHTYSDKFGREMKELSQFGRDIVLNLPIGSVDLPSSREEITYSDRSVKTISAVATSVHRMVEEGVQRILNAKPTGFEALKEIHSLTSGNFWKPADALLWRGKAAPIASDGAQFSVKSEIVRYLKTSDARKSLNISLATTNYTTSIPTWDASNHTSTVMIKTANDDEFLLANQKVKSYITDYHKALQAKTVQVFVFPPADRNSFWFEQGEAMTLTEFMAVGKEYRAKQRAEAKALAAARSNNPALKKKLPTEREVFHVDVTAADKIGYETLYFNAKLEADLLTGAKDFYYLSKEEVKDVSAELANLFPTRQSTGSGYLTSNFAHVLVNLKDILGADAKIVFVPATRNLEEFKDSYPHVPSVLDTVRDRVKAEWAAVENGNKVDTWLGDLFWLAENRNKALLTIGFARSLTPGEKVSLNSDILEVLDYMDPEKRRSNSRLNVLCGEVLGKQFTKNVSAWMEKKIKAVGDRYPLLTSMNPVGSRWDDLKPEMLRYLKTC